jgi:hypothetical protein
MAGSAARFLAVLETEASMQAARSEDFSSARLSLIVFKHKPLKSLC